MSERHYRYILAFLFFALGLFTGVAVGHMTAHPIPVPASQMCQAYCEEFGRVSMFVESRGDGNVCKCTEIQPKEYNE